jgi:predicted nucleic acid-binding protein
MTTAIDTNVIVALWESAPQVSGLAQAALDRSLERGDLVVAAPVVAELIAAPGRNERFVDSFFRHTGVRIDWTLDEKVWRIAGAAFQRYAARRRSHGDPGPRRILTDFLIGAHAFRYGHTLLTADSRLYRAAFPDLVLASL